MSNWQIIINIKKYLFIQITGLNLEIYLYTVVLTPRTCTLMQRDMYGESRQSAIIHRILLVLLITRPIPCTLWH